MPELPWLTATLRDFLFLPEDLDLPQLSGVTLSARYDEPGWTARAQLKWLPTNAERYEALQAWALVSGDRVELGQRGRDGQHKSGYYREAHVTVSHVGIELTVWTHLDAQAALDLTAHVRPSVRLPEPELSDGRCPRGCDWELGHSCAACDSANTAPESVSR